MKKALLIVDMQEEYIGMNSQYKYENKEQLIQNIQNKINTFEGDILYFKNKRKDISSNIIQEIMIPKAPVFVKEKSSCFSNQDWIDYISEHLITEITVAGIDGNCCVRSTALDGIKMGLNVVIDLHCIGVMNGIRFEKTKERLHKCGVKMM